MDGLSRLTALACVEAPQWLRAGAVAPWAHWWAHSENNRPELR